MKSRIELIHKIMEHEPAVTFNDWEYPENPERFLVVELSDGDIVWADDVPSLEAAKNYADMSDTDRDAVAVYDLDTPDESSIHGCKAYRAQYTLTNWTLQS